MELVSFQTIPREAKLKILQALGYDAAGAFVIQKGGSRVHDKYTGEEVRFENCVVLPGSTIVLDNNPLSIACYLEEYGDPI
jgi:hypothetical protein